MNDLEDALEEIKDISQWARGDGEGKWDGRQELEIPSPEEKESMAPMEGSHKEVGARKKESVMSRVPRGG